jgi:agmatinase
MSNLDKLLTIPGNGVFTVHTAQERKDSLLQMAYNTTDQELIHKTWQASLSKITKSDQPALLGVCSDTGGGILRGANWGPLFIREQIYKNVATDSFEDFGDVRVIPHLLHDKYLNFETIESCREALYQNKNEKLPVSPLSVCEAALDEIYQSNPNKKIIGLGGDHSVSYPLVLSWAKNMKRQKTRAALIHFDAHTDLLDKRLGIDICFGSWAYHILEHLTDSTDLYQLGIRSSGKDRGHWEKKFNINQIWANEIKAQGPGVIADNIIQDLKSKGIEKLYISFDIDALDEQYASATGTPEKGGLDPHESMTIINKLLNHFELTGADMVEVAPFINYPNATPHAQETTVNVASDIVELFLTKAQNA